MNNPEKNILKPVAHEDAVYLVNARQKIYLSSTEIYLPNIPYKKTKTGLEVSEKKNKHSSSSSITSEEDKLERSLRRTYTSIKDIFMCNAFDMFTTFTFKAGRDNPELCRAKMMGWLKRQRKADKSFQYVIVSEFHKDGKSLHFHALIKGYQGKIVRAINPNTGQPLVKKRRVVYDLPSYTLGHSEAY